MDIRQIEEKVKGFDNSHSIMPLMVDGVDKGTTQKYIKEGFCGVVANILYDDDFPNSGTAWDEVKNRFTDYIRNGLSCIVYDECGYPSGTARGGVLDVNPDFCAKGLFCYVHWKCWGPDSLFKTDMIDGDVYKILLVGDTTGKIIDITDCMDKNRRLRYRTPSGESWRYTMLAVRPLYEGTHATNNECETRRYISMSDIDATQTFIELTHENYKKHLGDYFGKGINAFFTDEPSLISYTLRQGWMPILPWHEKYESEFESKYGYPFIEAIVAVLLPRTDNYIKLRCDYWEYISHTVSKGYFYTIKEWCERNGVASVGHLLSEEDIRWHIVNYGSMYETMKQFTWPGVDQLGTTKEQLMTECFPFAKMAASVAELYGVGESLSEFSDIKSDYSGHIVGLDDYYRSANWHIFMGINNFVSLYSFANISEEEKAEFNHYVSFINQLMRLGKRQCSTAILYPDVSLWGYYNPNANSYATDYTVDSENLQNAFCKVSWELFHRQIDFDIIDNNVIESGDIVDNSLSFKDKKYSNVILPYCKILSDKTVEKLLKLVNNGVKVICVDAVPSFIRETGLCGDSIKTFVKLQEENKVSFIFSKQLDIVKEIVRVNDKISLYNDDKEMLRNILVQQRKVDESTYLVFIVNMNNEDCSSVIMFDNVNEVFELNLKDKSFIKLQLGANEKADITIPNGKARVFLFESK